MTAPTGEVTILQAVLGKWVAFESSLRSNILFPVGTMIGERLLYIPSAGREKHAKTCWCTLPA